MRIHSSAGPAAGSRCLQLDLSLASALESGDEDFMSARRVFCSTVSVASQMRRSSVPLARLSDVLERQPEINAVEPHRPVGGLQPVIVGEGG